MSEDPVAAGRGEVVDGRLRCYYRLTPRGSERLAAEAERLQQNAGVAVRRLARGHAIGGLA